ncbi:MAG: hypothetical protein EPO21_11505 [Chloroflexota bacterium]|nr:MAG: hypothetical protein EPO21_11505 [Chloroflexota bacterium]
MVEKHEGEQPDRITVDAALPESIVKALGQLASTARASAAFGEPHSLDGRTVIPVAEVMCGFGFGMGSGEGSSPGGVSGSGSGAGGGGGGGARSRPVAAIVVGPEGVHVRPILDMGQIYLAAITAGVIGLFWLKGALWRSGALEKGLAAPSPRALSKLLHRR